MTGHGLDRPSKRRECSLVVIFLFMGRGRGALDRLRGTGGRGVRAGARGQRGGGHGAEGTGQEAEGNGRVQGWGLRAGWRDDGKAVSGSGGAGGKGLDSGVCI